MGWLNALRGSIAGLDTSPLIYFIERHPRYLPVVYPFFESVERGEIQIVTSTLTLAEVLVHPLRQANEALTEAYLRVLTRSANVAMVAASAEIAMEAARLRAVYNIRTPDAMQLATATRSGATFFLTNDRGLPSVPGLSVILLDDLQ